MESVGYVWGREGIRMKGKVQIQKKKTIKYVAFLHYKICIFKTTSPNVLW